MAFKKQSTDRDDVRNDILREVENGSLSPADAERMAAAKGLPPFENAPSPDDFDVHALGVWTLEMTLAWIIWRAAGKVALFDDRLRAHWHYWRLMRTIPRGIRPDGKGHLPPRPSYTLEIRPPATLAVVEHGDRSALQPSIAAKPDIVAIVSFRAALDALLTHLVDGRIKAHAIEFDTRRPSPIPAHAWRYAELKVQGGVTCLFIDKDQDPAFQKVTFRTAEVLSAWKAQQNSHQELEALKQQRRLSDKVRPGRPPKFDWVAFDAEAFDKLDEWGGIQLTTDPLFHRARLRKHMAAWMAPQYEDSPSDATLKLQVKRAVAAYEQHVLERNR